MKIFIIEDDISVVSILEDIVERNGLGSVCGDSSEDGVNLDRIMALNPDLILVDLDHPQMIGDYNLIANMVYSADSSVIDTVICAGKVLMRNRYVPGEEEIISCARQVCRKIAM